MWRLFLATFGRHFLLVSCLPSFRFVYVAPVNPRVLWRLCWWSAQMVRLRLVLGHSLNSDHHEWFICIFCFTGHHPITDQVQYHLWPHDQIMAQLRLLCPTWPPYRADFLHVLCSGHDCSGSQVDPVPFEWEICQLGWDHSSNPGEEAKAKRQ